MGILDKKRILKGVKMKSLIVLSGGMDSATALAYALKRGDECETISFNYGSKHNDREFYFAEKFCQHYGVKTNRVDLTFIDSLFKSDLLKSGGEIPEGHYADPSMKRTVVPFRNGIMLSIAAGYAESIEFNKLVIGNHFGDHAIYPDCRQSFINPMSAAVFNGTYKNIILDSPFCYISKTEIARIGSKLNVPYGLTYSCYKGGEKHCGKCGTCFERKEAFRDAGIEDPTEYEL